MRGLQQQLDENARLILLRGLAAIPEQFLELVDDDQRVAMAAEVRVTDDPRQAERPTPKLGERELPVAAGVVRVQHAWRQQGVGQGVERRAARTHQGHAPVGTGLDHEARLERRQQASPHER